ncbi:GNAT superfamily N-acetyltransferase [Pedobacter cryoconitis]|uniref:GNAT family N-acetyltransferase n=1 Tax=Pedobacter cryoconitis TaxID=188932 RepID=UPI001616B04B|nr:GNAT family N-acetyltransferase [Pedobacter cryoconitis]MBB6269770.1 GNAT superfamily N-acetyltransferase [Pedobacter cryoconitis]
MSLHLRNLRLEDSEAISSLSEQLGYPSTISETEARINALLLHPDNCAFVAVLEQTIIGWIHGFYTLRLESEPFIEIAGLVVDENYRNQQTGKKLVEQVKEWGIKKGISKLRVRCQTKRTETHRFYQKIGFTQQKEQKVFDMDM